MHRKKLIHRGSAISVLDQNVLTFAVEISHIFYIFCINDDLDLKAYIFIISLVSKTLYIFELFFL